jgi:hypothetical protein
VRNPIDVDCALILIEEGRRRAGGARGLERRLAESVTKVLQELRKEGMLATGRWWLTILDLPRLRRRCEHPTADHVRVLLGSVD